MKTLKIMNIVEAGTPRDTIAPGERGLFGNMPCIGFAVRRVIAYAFDGKKTIELPVTELHVGNPSYRSDPDLYRKFDVKDGRVEDVQVEAGERYGVVVVNDLDMPVAPKIVVEGLSDEGGCGKTFTSAGEPIAYNRSTPRLLVPANGSATYMQDPPCAGQVSKFTMRSDSQLDVDVAEIRISNVCLTIGGEHPVEFYREGWALTPFTVARYNRLYFMLRNKSNVARWVEIDVDFEPEAQSEKRPEELPEPPSTRKEV